MKLFLTRAWLVTALLLTTLALTSCNEHFVDGCRPDCASDERFEEFFAMCVAYGTEDCRAGNRECCSLEAGCRGEIGDQIVTVQSADMCVDLRSPECLPPCDFTSYEFDYRFEVCLESGMCLSPSPEVCCAQEAGCLGVLGGVVISPEREDCCAADADCPDGSVCDTEELWRCVDAACAGGAMCSSGRECVADQCVCATDGGPTVHCPGDQFCYYGSCQSLDPCADVSCPSGTECVYGECLQPCAIDTDCPSGEVCPFADYCQPGCSTDEECLADGGYCDPIASVCFACFDMELACDGHDEDCSGVPDDGGVCSTGFCGDGFFDPSSEACDGPDLGGLVCADVDPTFHSGTLACRSDCLDFDVSGCSAEICDNDMDDDGDGLYDCQQPSCQAERFCCDAAMFFDPCDGVDNDCDGSVDEDGDVSCDDVNDCTGPDQCLSGSCDHPFLPADTLCGATSGFCDGAGTCIAG